MRWAADGLVPFWFHLKITFTPSMNHGKHNGTVINSVFVYFTLVEIQGSNTDREAVQESKNNITTTLE